MLNKIFLQILNMSFTGGIVILFVLLARVFLKRAPKIFSYALWSVVLFRLICPFSFESIFSLLPVKANPIKQNIVYMQIPQIDTGSVLINDSVNAILPAGTLSGSVNPLQIWVFVGSVIWIMGIALLLAYSIASLIQLKKQVKFAAPYKDNILLSQTIETAFVLGIFHPKIYLPASLTNRQREYILLHEQTHIKRFDHVVKIANFFILALHWFNPLAWIAFFESGKDMEMSCDEAVVKKLGNKVKKEYSTSLLTLATSRNTLGGMPLAFGEGNTKSRIKNVLNYKKPAFWVVVVSIIAAICIIVGLMANPKEKPTGFAGVNAIVLEIDKDSPSMTVMGMDENSVIGDKCVVTWEPEALDTVEADGELKQLEINDFAVGDYVSLFIGEVQETYPTSTKATTVQLQPKEAWAAVYSAESLWEARTPYLGNNSDVGKLIGLLPVSMGLKYDHFELHTAEQPYIVEIVYSMPTQLLESYALDDTGIWELFNRNALLLYALIDNVDEIHATLTDGSREISFINGREWANETVNADVRNYAQTSQSVQELIDWPIDAKIYSSTAESSRNKDGKIDQPKKFYIITDDDSSKMECEYGSTSTLDTLQMLTESEKLKGFVFSKATAAHQYVRFSFSIAEPESIFLRYISEDEWQTEYPIDSENYQIKVPTQVGIYTFFADIIWKDKTKETVYFTITVE